MSNALRLRPFVAYALALSAILVLGSFPVAVPEATAQETNPALEHEDTYQWSSIQGRVLSPDGEWLAWVERPWDADPTLLIARTDGSATRRHPRGEAPTFTRDGRFLAFRVTPAQVVLDSMRREGDSNSSLPGDSLVVLDLAAHFASEGDVIGRYGPIDSFDVPSDGGAYVAWLYSEDPDAEDETDEEGEEAEEEEESEEGEGEAEEEEEEEERSAEYEKRHEKDEGEVMGLLDLDSGSEFTFDNVVRYSFADAGTRLAFVTSTEDEGGDGVHLVDPASGNSVDVLTGEGHYLQLAFDESGSVLAFLSNRDEWELDQPGFALYTWSDGDLNKVADHASAGVPAGWWVSENGNVSISDDGDRVFFGTAPRPEPEPEPEDEPLSDDRVTLDVWNWRDDYLQPMQLVQANRERNRSYLAVAHMGREGVVQLATTDVPETSMTQSRMGDHFLGSSDLPYRQEISWDGRYQDAYAVNVETGERRRLATRVRGFGGVSLSPDGGWALWWDGGERDWKAAPLDGSAPVKSLTADLPEAFHNELDDHPQDPPPYGSGGWVEGDAAVLLSDKHDVWRINPERPEDAIRLTSGRENGRRYRVAPQFSEGFGYELGRAIAEGDLTFGVFDMETKASGFALGSTDSGPPQDLIVSDARYRSAQKARDGDRIVWQRETFSDYPDLWTSDDGFENAQRLSDANPQQAEYRWGSAELVSWTSNDGTPLDGILIKPDGFDPAQQYPMMVYFYERMSDQLHGYRPPTPGSSSVAWSFYVSRGYVVFVPDIPYEIGYPGESAIDAVVPGVLSLIDEGFVDPDQIGVQGHSWGGYQIAYMLTKTNLFAAAEAGAPVSNMTSAYGGIRWQSGMSRMFQYERTQSRIGGTLWDERDRYVHNSPVFFADKIQTPMLMLHNDDDGAVPWYQGIEMFVAMRRLGIPVYMLNYNNEGHGLRRRANQEDWAKRMQQFFDHYVLGAPAPRWISEGVRAVDKGRDLGLEVPVRKVSAQGGAGG